MQLPKAIANLGLCVLLFCQGCVNLQKINDYSTGSLDHLRGFEAIGYTFEQACQDACLLERFRSQSLLSPACDCSQEQTADSVTLLIYHACKNYFDGLSKLSGNSLTDYKVNTLAKTINESALISGTPQKKEVVEAYAQLSNTLLRMSTDHYRKKQLKNVIGAANAPIRVLLSYLHFNLYNNLTGKLNVQEEKLKNGLYPELLQSAQTALEKKMVIANYNRDMALIDNRKKQIASFTKGLTRIANGHNELYEHRNRLSAAELQTALTQYISDIESAISEFHKIKNANN